MNLKFWRPTPGKHTIDILTPSFYNPPSVHSFFKIGDKVSVYCGDLRLHTGIVINHRTNFVEVLCEDRKKRSYPKKDVALSN